MLHDVGQPSNTVTRSARTIGFAVLGSRVLGLVREQVLASLFGASEAFDAFITAFRIPNLLRDLFAEGALSAAFVSGFTRKLTMEGDKPAWRLANLVVNALLVVLSIITLIGILAAPVLVNAIAPGFASVPGKTELTITLTRIMFPFLLLVALAALAMGMLNAKRVFGIPASASMMFNIGSIVGGVAFAYWLDPHFGPRAMIGMSIGTLIGGAAQFLIQVPSLRRVGYRYEPILDRRDPDFRRIVTMLGPSVIGAAAVQVNIFVNSWFASVENGAVTWLNCAFRLMQFPIGVFGVALATATLPAISAFAARNDLEKFRETLARSIRLAVFLSLPSACGLAVLAEPIISVIYQHGRFDAVATARTAQCLQMFAIGLAGYAALKVLAPAFYAFGDSRTPARVAIFSIALNAGLCWLFAWKLGLGAKGLAMSTALVALTNLGQLFWHMRKRLQQMEGGALLRSFAKVALASLVMSVTAWSAHEFLPLNRYVNLATSITVAIVAFGAACWALRVAELGELLAVLRFGKRATLDD
ncbi:MAG: murein biosynthesis integral membrane protein MurJ [Verrucomicrobia bacterium]|nr:murein biosynthesis integral membrane protein MurJ [Verrucomicrobiota bacterium]